jgi:two-component system, chemotaxis family, protein-glutamate methylesterase/glutaminase
MNQTIRVVVVDDSALMRRVITGLLEQDPAIRVVGAACNGREAIEMVQELRPDIVTMDVRMPVMDGLATTEHLMAYCPTPILVLTASLARHDVDITFKMLGAGALEVIEKPSAADSHALDRAGRALIRRIKVLARVKVVTHLRGRRKPNDGPDAPKEVRQQRSGEQEGSGQRVKETSKKNGDHTIQVSPPVTRPDGPPPFPLIVIGASTGGPRVVYQILAGLPRDLPAAVLVVQHIAEGFSAGMAEWLANASTLPVHLAHEGRALKPREVLVAPDRRDLLITRENTVHLSENPLLIQRPSIDICMQAAAEVFGSRAIGVLLTGMGRDGAYGMLTIQRANGYTIAQDEATSTIFGMPRAAIQLGAASEVLPASRIAERLVALIADAGRPTVLLSGKGVV